MTKKQLGELRKDYRENKKEWDEMLEAGTKAKHEACTKRDKKRNITGFDYIKMSQMIHSGKW